MNVKSKREFLARVRDTMAINPEWRYGQAVFNLMTAVNLAYAEGTRGFTAIDPYYNDDNVNKFLDGYFNPTGVPESNGGKLFLYRVYPDGSVCEEDDFASMDQQEHDDYQIFEIPETLLRYIEDYE